MPSISQTPHVFVMYLPPILQHLIHKQASHAHATANAHAGQEDLLLCPPQLAQPRDYLPGTRGTKRVAERDGSPPGVHFAPVQIEFVTAVNSHGSERLVELNHVAVVESDGQLRKQLGNGDAGTDTHDARGETCDRAGDVLAQDGLVEGEGCGPLHQ